MSALLGALQLLLLLLLVACALVQLHFEHPSLPGLHLNPWRFHLPHRALPASALHPVAAAYAKKKVAAAAGLQVKIADAGLQGKAAVDAQGKAAADLQKSQAAGQQEVAGLELCTVRAGTG